jgi:uncharacterized protein (DUF2141 family)
MKFFVFIISIILFLLPQGGKHRLVVKVTGLKPLKGELYISLHNRPEYFNIADSAFLKQKIAVDNETETFIFDRLPDSRYAIAVYHDENLNGKLDVNELGIPREGYGFSDNPKGMGRPKFEQTAFDFGRNDTIEIKMVYHKAPDEKK